MLGVPLKSDSEMKLVEVNAQPYQLFMIPRRGGGHLGVGGIYCCDANQLSSVQASN